MEQSDIVKIILVGDSGIGKTSLMQVCCGEMFSNTFISTIGVDFRIKNVNINKTPIKLHIWDTAGQERFRSISKSYFRGAHVILLIFDLGNRRTFYNLEEWMNDIRSNIIFEPKIILVGNKYENIIDVTENEIQIFANKYHLEYFGVSAKNNVNIEELFNKAVLDGYNIYISNEISYEVKPCKKINRNSCC